MNSILKPSKTQYLYFDKKDLAIIIKCLKLVRDHSNTSDHIRGRIEVILEKFEIVT